MHNVQSKHCSLPGSTIPWDQALPWSLKISLPLLPRHCMERMDSEKRQVLPVGSLLFLPQSTLNTQDSSSFTTCPDCPQPERRTALTQTLSPCQVGTAVLIARTVHTKPHVLSPNSTYTESTETPHTSFLPKSCMSGTLFFITVICPGKLDRNIHKSQIVN